MMETRVGPHFEGHPGGDRLFLVDKPAGWTSFDVVHRMRHIFKVKKIGHAGTLDPLATGLLIVCAGSRTKEVDRYAGLEKEYDVEMVLGARTESFDGEMPIIERRSTEEVTEGNVREVLSGFVGLQQQVPPMWSAVKVRGKRLYEYARKGKEVERKAREVVIISVTPTRIEIPLVTFAVVCSKGTYVRALVNDIGTKLGCGAYVTRLRRTRIGPYHIGEASTLEDLARQWQGRSGAA